MSILILIHNKGIIMKSFIYLSLGLLCGGVLSACGGDISSHSNAMDLQSLNSQPLSQDINLFALNEATSESTEPDSIDTVVLDMRENTEPDAF
jgi:hypothetical protein